MVDYMDIYVDFNYLYSSNTINVTTYLTLVYHFYALDICSYEAGLLEDPWVSNFSVD